MRQLLLPRSMEDGDRYTVTGEDFHYLDHVLRLREGALIVAGDPQGTRYRLTLERRLPDRHVFRVRKASDPGRRSGPEMVLAMCLPKPAKMDLIVRMCTEIGVDRIEPVVSELGEIRGKDISRLGNRVMRWRKIARAAFQQCGRSDLPGIEEIKPLDAIKPSVQDKEVCIFADELGGRPLHSLLAAETYECIRLLVGPEGGFSTQERENLGAKGFLPVSLGKNILRTETAAVVLCAAARLLVSEKAWWKTK